MYLRTILKRPEDDLVRRVYKVQKTDKVPSDWADTVDDNRKKYEINLTDEQIEATSKYKFENIVKKSVNDAGIQYLNDKAANHSKSVNLMKSEVIRSKYLDDTRFSLSDSQLLFKMRTKMLPVKTNFPAMWNNDVSCRTCHSCVQIESQEH